MAGVYKLDIVERRFFCQDETRIGLKTISGRKITSIGVKPKGKVQWQFKATYLYGVVEVATGEHFFYKFPHLNSDCFGVLLNLVSEQYKDSILIIQLDQAGAHRAKRLQIPSNIILMFQPSHSPETNPIERVWQHLKLMGAKKALEVGVFTGYSSLVVALALPPQGRLIACDVSEEYTAIACRYWELAGVAHKIDLRIAPALETLDQLLAGGHGNTFDFAFIDADKSNYAAYYDRAIQLVRPGGLIAVDNVLWSGRVADLDVQDNRTEAIRAFNEKLHQDERILPCMVAIADGLTLALKRD